MKGGGLIFIRRAINYQVYLTTFSFNIALFKQKKLFIVINFIVGY